MLYEKNDLAHIKNECMEQTVSTTNCYSIKFKGRGNRQLGHLGKFEQVSTDFFATFNCIARWFYTM